MPILVTCCPFVKSIVSIFSIGKFGFPGGVSLAVSRRDVEVGVLCILRELCVGCLAPGHHFGRDTV